MRPARRASNRSLADKRHERHLRAVVEDRAGDRAAEVDVEAGPFALAVLLREPEQAFADAALHDTALLDGLEGSGRGRERESDKKERARNARRRRSGS